VASAGASPAIRTAVIGCGEVAQIMHLPYLNELPHFELTAVCDLSARITDAVADRFGVRRRYTDYRELLRDGDLDAVVVATFDHRDTAIAAAEAGLHLLVEKPLAWSPQEAQEIIDAADANGVKLMVGYMKRFDAAVEYACQRVGEMEGVRLVRAHDFAGSFTSHVPLYTLVRGDDLAPSARSAAEDAMKVKLLQVVGGDEQTALRYQSLLMLSSHDLSVLRGLIGEIGDVVSSRRLGARGVTAVLAYGQDGTCVFEIDPDSDFSWWDEEIVVYGRREILSLRFPNPFVKHAETVVTIRRTEDHLPVTLQTPVSVDEAFRRELCHFAACITTGGDPRTGGADAKADIELLLEVASSAR
jgi:predicted dehydrogenase